MKNRFAGLGRKMLSLTVALTVMLSGIPITAAAAEGETCSHIHGSNCSYMEGADCGFAHEHDGDCGYIEAVDCDHEHDENCGGLTLGDSGGVVEPEEPATQDIEPVVAEPEPALANVRLLMETDANFEIVGGDSYETLQEAVGAVEDGGTIKMLQDVTLASNVYYIDLGRDIAYTIDLDGHTLSGGREHTFYVRWGRITIKNGVINNAGIDGICVTGATVVLDRLTVVATGDLSQAVRIENGNVSILSGDYTGELFAVGCFGGAVTISDGHFVSTSWYPCLRDYSSDPMLRLAPGSTADTEQWLNGESEVTVTAVSDEENAFLNTLSYTVDSGSAVPVPGFTPVKLTYDVVLPSDTDETATIMVTAETMIPDADINENDGVVLVNGAGTATVKVTAYDGVTTKTYTLNFRTMVANFETGGIIYETFLEAVNAVEDGGTITMLQDVTLDMYVELLADKTYTIDFDNHTLSENYGYYGYLLYVGKGTVTIKNGKFDNPEGSAIHVYGGDLSILSGEYTADVFAIYCDGGAVTITSGHFVSAGNDCLYELYPDLIKLAPGSTTNPEYWLNSSAYEVTITGVSDEANPFLNALSYTVAGGTVIPVPDFKYSRFTYNVVLPPDTAAESVITMLPTPIIPNATVTSNSGFALVNGAGTATVEVASRDGTGTQTYTVNFRTKLNNFEIDDGSKYETPSEAAAAVQYGGTITMLQDVQCDEDGVLNEYGYNEFTLDLGGHTLSGDTDCNLVIIQGEVTIKNGRIINNGDISETEEYDRTDQFCIWVAYATVTLDNLTVLAEGDNTPAVVVDGGYAVILSGEYSGKAHAVYCQNGGMATITAGRFTSRDGSALGTCAGGNMQLDTDSVASPVSWLDDLRAKDVTVTNLLPVTNTGGATAVTYPGAAIDLSAVVGLFGVDTNAGARTYSLETGGTGTGSIGADKKTLTVTKAGTFTIGLVTAATGTHKAGAKVTATLTVDKATPGITTWPTASGVTYGAALSASTLSGGVSTGGTFVWTTPATVPTVNNSGYGVTFIPSDTDNYDWSGVTKTNTVNIAVTAKALTITGAVHTKVYDGGAEATGVDGWTFSGWVGSDDQTVTVSSYTAAYTSTNAGTATINVTGMTLSSNNYTATVPANGITVTGITKKLLTNAMITGTIAAVTYNGTAYTPTPAVADGTILQASDYTWSYANNTAAGTATATIMATAGGNYSGTASKDFTINAKSASTLTIDAISAQTYTGNVIEPTVTVRDGSTALTLTTDYTVGYSSNTNVGTAAVTITGAGNYTGTKTATFTINKTDPTVNWPTNLTATYGQTLADVSLPGDGTSTPEGLFNWTAAATTSVGNAGGNSFNVTFTPSDTANYNTASQNVTVAVSKKSVSGVPQTFNVLTNSPQSYTFDLKALLPGGVTNADVTGYTFVTATNANGIFSAVPAQGNISGYNLTLAIANIFAANLTDTVTIGFTSANYNISEAVITVNSVNKTPVTITGVTMTGGVYKGSEYAYSGTPIFTPTAGGSPVTVSTFDVLYESTDSGGYSSVTAPTSAGAYKLTLSVPVSNAIYTGSAVFTFTIAKKQVTVKADNKTARVGDALPSPLTVSYTGFIGTDTKDNALQTQAAAQHTAADAQTAGAFPISFATNAALNATNGSNYTLDHQNGILSVTNLATFTITATAGANGSITPSGAVPVTEGDSQTFTVSANGGYHISGVTVDGVNKGVLSSYTFTGVTGNHTISAAFAINSTGGGRSSGGSGGGGGGGGGTTTGTMPALTTSWLEQNPAETLANGANGRHEDNARTKSTGAYGVRAAAWAKLAGLRFGHDTMDGSFVQVRIYINSPEKITKDMMVSGYVKDSEVDNIKSVFEKWFKNKVRVIHFDHPGAWGQPAEIAAKVDLIGMDDKKLCFYAYDKKTNTYTLIEKPAYWIDKNGYLHFTTEYAGDIIISDGLLERK